MNKHFSLDLLKVALLCGVFTVLPAPVSAETFYTKQNDENVYTDFYKDDYEYWCINEPERIEEKIERTRDGGYEHYQTEREIEERLVFLYQQREQISGECRSVEERIRPVGTGNTPRCGENFVLMNNQCIRHTENCKAHYGPNLTGFSADSQLISACTCNEGYAFKGAACVLEEVTSVGATTTPVEIPQPVVQEPVIKEVIIKEVIKYVPVPQKQELKVEVLETEVQDEQAETIVEETLQPEVAENNSVEFEVVQEEQPQKPLDFWDWLRGLFGF